MKIVCELGLNTQGDLDTALRMVEAAAEAGADGVKVQAFDTEDFLPEGHPDWEMFEGNRLTWGEIVSVQAEAVSLGLEFGATPTSVAGVQILAEMKVDWLKNGSDYLLRHDMIEAMLETGIETWVSVGMASAEEIYAVPRGAKIMACTSLYPCPPEAANILRVADADGYSDHTEGTTAAVMAVALGAEMWEGHFTLRPDLEGPDHHFSRTPGGLSALVREVRRAELMLGSGQWEMHPDERVNREAWRVTEGTLRRG